MKKLLIILTLIIATSYSFAQSQEDMTVENSQNDTLVVLWTSGDHEVAENVCLMYTHAAARSGWFKTVILVVWGPSANLLSNNHKLQSKVKSMISDGIHVRACIVCANSYGVSDQLRDIGIEVLGMGKPLTGYLKKGCSILTF